MEGNRSEAHGRRRNIAAAFGPKGSILAMLRWGSHARGSTKRMEGSSQRQLGHAGSLEGPVPKKPPQPGASAATLAAATAPSNSSKAPVAGSLDPEAELNATLEEDKDVRPQQILMALGGGMGANIGATGNLELDIDLIRRMRYQDKAVMLLLLFMYFVTLGCSTSFAYRQALNDSPVTFYADPRYHDMVAEGQDTDGFLDAFNQAPKDVFLQVAGFIPVPPGALGSIEWQGHYYHDAFSFALDLSPWVVREEGCDLPGDAVSSSTGDGESSGRGADRPAVIAGVVAEDLDSLHHFVSHDANDLAIVELRKEVSWASWEELATNIKLRIRQRGFNGIISIHRTECESVCIYKNTAWANFMHSRTTKVLCALSVLGWIIYLPYMWLRCSIMSVRSCYIIDIPIETYWGLIEDKLTADGFVAHDTVAAADAAEQPESATTGARTMVS